MKERQVKNFSKIDGVLYDWFSGLKSFYCEYNEITDFTMDGSF